MSPVFKNELDHAIYATVDGRSHKLGAGKVAAFTGAVADGFQGLVEQGYASKLSAADGKKAIEAQHADSVDPTLTAEGRLPSVIAAVQGRVGLLSVSAPLQVVVGDDLAPFGPPSGEVTTKQALAAADPGGVDRRQFAENEVLVGDPQVADQAPATSGAQPVTANEAHEAQRQARRDLEAGIAELEIAGASTAPLEPVADEDGEGETPPPAE